MENIEILKRDKYTCQKCGYTNLDGTGLEIHHIDPKHKAGLETATNKTVLCSICHHYAPDDPRFFQNYINEKIDGTILDTFRKSNWSISERTKAGMAKKLSEGNIISKAPKGYKLINKQLSVDEIQADIVKKLFEEYLTTSTSLTRLSQKYGLTTSGLIKILKNPIYIGMIRIKDTEYKGNHKPILDKELYEKVQLKLQGNVKSVELNMFRKNE
jgi:hypothetical protein